MSDIKNNNSIHSEKNRMLICPRLNEYNETIDNHTIYNDSSQDSFPFYEYEYTLNENSNDPFSIDSEVREGDFHYNLMNRKIGNPNHDIDSDFSDKIFGDEMQYPNNFQVEVNRILRRIEFSDPNIFRFLATKGISYPMARRLVRRIIILTLRYSRSKL
ncbi:hypothetical protein [Clostridium cylindrosporum]|uniref:Uncharacterized protein n=1 Tax=Clostridium cylindrosporum DSM 605 TaxID=1121307 RepID=A0A0J8D911_CLOCY|nr:hypothetical protein [Clostridium cylindrosporum]KMT20839.1 hypothetical protein CLCY_1c00730 [Clostridium cylindrosporum DSM 605]